MLALVLATASCDRVPQRPPSILLLNIDTLRADHLGCYGYHRPTSPQLDNFARGAARFDWAFAQAPYTPPSQASILTGRYVAHHGVRTRKDRLKEEVPTLAGALAAGGYRTGGFVDGGFLSRPFGLARGFDEFDDEGGGLNRIGPKAIAWLRQHAGEPLFLMVHTYDVHTPYAPEPSYRGLFLEGITPSAGFEPTAERMEEVRHSMWTGDPQPLPPADLAFAEALYDAEIRFVDDWIGRFLAEIDSLRLTDRCLVVVLSDHGEEFGEHGSVMHEKLYTTVTRIPLLLRLPGRLPAIAHSGVVEAIDVMPTLLEIAGLRGPPGVDGVSLLPLLRGEAARKPTAAGENPYNQTNRYFLVRDPFHLLYRPGTNQLEIFAFRSDPKEQLDLAAREPAEVARLKQAMQGLVVQIEREMAAAPEAEIDPDTHEQLRALGYLR